MQKTIHYTAVVLVMAAFLLAGCGQPSTGTRSLLGRDKANALDELGEPSKILGPAEGYQTYHYAKRGLGVVFHDNTVVQYVIRTNSSLKTEMGIGIGADISDVTGSYGQYKRTEEVTEWFGGNAPKVLYHHKQLNRYKINYPDSDLIFMFDGNKKVEMITVGYIFPVEKD